MTIVTLAVMLAGLAPGAVPSDAKVYQVCFVPEAQITVDGVADEPVWVKVCVERGFSFPWKKIRPPRTEFRALCDGKHFYFTFTADDEDIVVVEDFDEESDATVEDRCELIFSRDEELKEYYSMEMDSRGRYLDFKASYYRQFDFEWDFPGLCVAAAPRENGYVVEGSIPLASLEKLGFPPLEPGRRIKFGVFRAEFSHGQGPGPEESWISWVDPGTDKPDFHVPAAFGYIEVVRDTPQSVGDFPAEIVDFVPYERNPVFAGTGKDTWDRKIRERGYILREGEVWHLWYTGYRGSSTKHLGYATSSDGLHWKRHPDNPIFDQSWVEDMCVVKHGGTYYMFAEGRHDIAHMLTSRDGVQWQDHGSLDVRQTSGEPISPGPYGTPTVWIEGPTWYLFYERGDRGVWLATSTDRAVWTNVKDDPVIACGPETYDQHAVALNQVIKHQGRYYGWYHGSAHMPWRDWSTNVAVSDDLVQWKKYPKNPVVAGDKSSGILVHDGKQYRLYTLHPDVRVYFPRRPR